MKILAIDPGTTESAYALINLTDRRPVKVDKIGNDQLLEHLTGPLTVVDHLAIEMVASYGMAVGREVFETCVWIGRFHQAAVTSRPTLPVDLIYRRDVKLHHCASAKANDANISQALVDRFASGVRNRGKGTKAEPGFFYGFKADIWQAYAIAVLVADRVETSPTQHAAGF